MPSFVLTATQRMTFGPVDVLKQFNVFDVKTLEPRRLMASDPVNLITEINTHLVSLSTETATATGLTRATLLRRLEVAVRGVAAFQNASGAILDPVEKREVQYSTPYFAYAASTLIRSGRATDLIGAATKALDRAFSSYAKGIANIPDRHGEFYLFPMAKAYKNLAPLVSRSTPAAWLTRLKTPLKQVLQGLTWNWRTYAMKGVWALYGIGALSRSAAVNFIESSWTDTQKARFNNTLSQYEDRTGDPDTIAYDYAARANLMYLVTAGYNGPSAVAIRSAVMKGNAAGLYLIDPTGQVSNTGRSGNHVWNDLVAAVSFERQARTLANRGYVDTAETFQRAAASSILSTDRWIRSDGLYQVTKNAEACTQKRGYADYSGLTNYNGYMILHLSELVEEWHDNLGEKSMPSETGGYALKTDADFATAVADAGGVHVNAALRGQAAIAINQFWTQLGVTRVSEVGWDSRLGTMAGEDPATKAAFSLAPAVYANGKYVRMAELASKYIATFTSDITTSQLTRATIVYKPRSSTSGLPTLSQTLSITANGVLMTSATTGNNIAATLPLLVNDGRPLVTVIGRTAASAAFSAKGDSLNYMVVDAGARLNDRGVRIAGATGDYDPLLATRAGQRSMSVFIYTRKPTDPTVAAVQQSFVVKRNSYSSVLGRVAGTTYVGANGIAGGYGTAADLDGDGIADVTFSKSVESAMSMRKGSPRFVEADDSVTYRRAGYSCGLTGLVARRVR